MAVFRCCAVSDADPVKHTVRIDPNRITAAKEEAAERKRLEELKVAERQERRRAAALAQAALQAERQRRQEEVWCRKFAARRAASIQAELEAQENARQLEIRAAEERELEQQRQEAECLEGQRRLGEWLARAKFQEPNAKRRGLFGGGAFPLHEAVTCNDAEIVALLLRAGADPSQVNASRQTPLRLAEHLAKRAPLGTFDAVLRALTCEDADARPASQASTQCSSECGSDISCSSPS